MLMITEKLLYPEPVCVGNCLNLSRVLTGTTKALQPRQRLAPRLGSCNPSAVPEAENKTAAPNPP